jgi:hypothetical protein
MLQYVLGTCALRCRLSAAMQQLPLMRALVPYTFLATIYFEPCCSQPHSFQAQDGGTSCNQHNIANTLRYFSAVLAASTSQITGISKPEEQVLHASNKEHSSNEIMFCVHSTTHHAGLKEASAVRRGWSQQTDA